MTQVILPTNPEDRKRIKKALQEISDSYTRISAERDLIKDVVEFIAEEFKLPKKHINKMARVFHKNNFDTEVAESEDFQALYETITSESASE